MVNREQHCIARAQAGMCPCGQCRRCVEDLGSDIDGLGAKLKLSEARVAELKALQMPRPIGEAPTNGRPVRVWVRTSDGSAAWFDARYNDGVWLESRIKHMKHGFIEVPGKVLRPSLFLPSTSNPDQLGDAALPPDYATARDMAMNDELPDD